MTWQEAEAADTPLWIACTRAAKKVLRKAIYLGAKSSYNIEDEYRGFAATIYDEVNMEKGN
jgi:hypothetical protein